MERTNEQFAAAIVEITQCLAYLPEGSDPSTPVDNPVARENAFGRLQDLIRTVETFSPGAAAAVEAASSARLAEMRRG